MSPRVWNQRRENVPPEAIYVGRGTPWGNPFGGAREEACDRFEREILPTLDVSKLTDRHLVCWCAPKRCHADALLRKANGK